MDGCKRKRYCWSHLPCLYIAALHLDLNSRKSGGPSRENEHRRRTASSYALAQHLPSSSALPRKLCEASASFLASSSTTSRLRNLRSRCSNFVALQRPCRSSMSGSPQWKVWSIGLRIFVLYRSSHCCRVSELEWKCS